MSRVPQALPAVTRSEEYTAENIEYLEGCEHIRRRPAMYLGSTDAAGLHRMVIEVVEHAVNEVLAGSCNFIRVELLPDGGCRVADNGPGRFIALGSQLFRHCSPEQGDNHTFSMQPSLFGIGLTAVCALSIRCEVEDSDTIKRFRQEFVRGRLVGPPRITAHVEAQRTMVSFWPDPEIFADAGTITFTRLADRFRELAFLNPGLKIELLDLRAEPMHLETFESKVGVAEFLSFLNESREPVHPNIIYIEGQENGQEFQLAMQWTRAPEERIVSFVNNHASTRGTHLRALRAALTGPVSKYGKIYGAIKEESLLITEDILEGLTAVLAMKLREPQWGSMRGDDLINLEVEPFIELTVDQWLSVFLECHPSEAVSIASRSAVACQARLNAEATRELKHGAEGADS